MSQFKSIALAIASSALAAGGAVAQSAPIFTNAGASPGWQGLYVGLTAGVGTGHQGQNGGASTTTCAGTLINGSCFVFGDGNYHLGGGLIGGGVGYNWQSEHFVYGLEADLSLADIKGSGVCGPPAHNCGGSIRDLTTVRARFGYDMGTFLPYVTGGWAGGQVHAWDALFGGAGSKFESGWTLGLGLEMKLAQHWSAKIEYLHVDLGSRGIFVAIPPNVEKVSTRSEVFRVGLNYNFWSPAAAPVFAKY